MLITDGNSGFDNFKSRYLLPGPADTVNAPRSGCCWCYYSERGGWQALAHLGCPVVQVQVSIMDLADRTSSFVDLSRIGEFDLPATRDGVTIDPLAGAVATPSRR